MDNWIIFVAIGAIVIIGLVVAYRKKKPKDQRAPNDIYPLW